MRDGLAEDRATRCEVAPPRCIHRYVFVEPAPDPHALSRKWDEWALNPPRLPSARHQQRVAAWGFLSNPQGQSEVLAERVAPKVLVNSGTQGSPAVPIFIVSCVAELGWQRADSGSIDGESPRHNPNRIVPGKRPSHLQSCKLPGNGVRVLDGDSGGPRGCTSTSRPFYGQVDWTASRCTFIL